MKVISFKTVSPLFEMERDGEKPFTTHRWDNKDSRFRALAQWRPAYKWAIKIVNPQTGESFIRRLQDYNYIRDPASRLLVKPEWIIIFLGKENKEVKRWQLK